MKKKVFIDKLFLFGPLFILLGISLINMYYAGLNNSGYQSYLFKQALWFGLGFFVIFIFSIIKPKILFKYSKYLYFINVLLLILVLFC